MTARDGGQPAWQESALCAQTDPELFVLEVGGSTWAAKRVCRRCPVAAPCLSYALTNDERYGVWGGLSAPERQRLARTTAARTTPGRTTAGSAA